MRRILSLLVLLAALAAAPAAHAWIWPAAGPVLRPFSLGPDAYAGGQHRGVDIGAELGSPVRRPGGRHGLVRRLDPGRRSGGHDPDRRRLCGDVAAARLDERLARQRRRRGSGRRRRRRERRRGHVRAARPPRRPGRRRSGGLRRPARPAARGRPRAGAAAGRPGAAACSRHQRSPATPADRRRTPSRRSRRSRRRVPRVRAVSPPRSARSTRHPRRNRPSSIAAAASVRAAGCRRGRSEPRRGRRRGTRVDVQPDAAGGRAGGGHAARDPRRRLQPTAPAAASTTVASPKPVATPTTAGVPAQRFATSVPSRRIAAGRLGARTPTRRAFATARWCGLRNVLPRPGHVGSCRWSSRLLFSVLLPRPSRSPAGAVRGPESPLVSWAAMTDPQPQKILVAVAWPYANGPRHIGHVAGFGVPSDIFARYHRLRGNDVLMVSGTDEHGTPVMVAADEAGVSPRELADRTTRSSATTCAISGCRTTCSHERRPRTTTRSCAMSSARSTRGASSSSRRPSAHSPPPPAVRSRTATSRARARSAVSRMRGATSATTAATSSIPPT